MQLNRRALLEAMAVAAVLHPVASHAAESLNLGDEGGPNRLPEQLTKVLGDRLMGSEQIAMLLYPGFTALDLVGPYHFLGGLPGAKTHLVTNQPDLRPVSSDIGLAVQPTTTMADCPSEVTVLFAPGGTIGTLAAARDRATIDFIRDRASRAQYITSVCTGSLVLGVAGVLRGKRATSHWSVVPVLRRLGAIPIRERLVRDGNIITGAGVSAGMDFGASLVAQLRSQPLAEVATLIAEYAPEPPFSTGSLESARPEIAEAAGTMLQAFVQDAETLRPIS